jgi:Tol biopolymer transport system component
VRSDPPATRSITRFSIPLAAGTQLSNDRAAVALSPDGGTAVVAATDGASARLYVWQLNGLAMTPLNGTEGASEPFFSPDGR